MTNKQDFGGVWRSRYTYTSSGRGGEFTNDHYVRLHWSDNQLVVETLPKVNRSYVVMRLSLDGAVATGNWQEETDPAGYYQGAKYYGAIQFVIDADKKHMAGKWVGFGKDSEVNTGPWELTYVGERVPTEPPQFAVKSA